MISQLGLDGSSMVAEIAANDGYLLQYVKAAAIPCYGVEPTHSTASAASAKGLTIYEQFFGSALAQELLEQGRAVDLLVANNVLAHVPDINDFVAGFAQLLKPQGVLSVEFPHLLNMVQQNQFDTAYHEHYSYLSLHAVQRIFAAQGLQVFDVQEWPTHGGSLRVLAQRCDSGKRAITAALGQMLAREVAAGMLDVAFYRHAQAAAETAKFALLEFLLDCRRKGLKIAAYGAAAKGNTLLNFAGVKADLLPYVVDINPHKQGKYLPGSRIPIVGVEHMQRHSPDVIVILPWNLHLEIMRELETVLQVPAQFFIAIPAIHQLKLS